MIDPFSIPPYAKLRALAEEGRLVNIVPVMTDQGPGLYASWTARFQFPPSSAGHPNPVVKGAFYVAGAQAAHESLKEHHGHT